MRAGRYHVTAWDTVAGESRAEFELEHQRAGKLSFDLPPLTTDLAFSIRRVAAV
jgi:hypothetical protein